MEGWFGILISGIVSLVTGIGGSIFYFRPKLKEANANAQKAQTDAQDYAYNSLLGRINQMEKMYNEQYAAQNNTIAALRSEVLKLTEEKYETAKEMAAIKGENNALRSRVDQLEKEVQAYKTIAGNK